AATPSVSLTVIDRITAAGVVQFSPADTSLQLLGYADHSLYFRDAPADDLQGAVIARLLADDGNKSAYILAADSSIGKAVSATVEATLKAAGVEVLGTKTYSPTATSFKTEVADIVSTAPNAVVLVTGDEASRILRTMVEKHVGPTDLHVYLCDPTFGDALGAAFDAGT
ncbi:MAG: ABC transporter substrate-binding protein, partial [Actinomycetota bacterium]